MNTFHMRRVALALVLAMGTTGGAFAIGGGTTEDPCSGLSGGAQGLCNAYCNAQNCPATPDKNSCAQLRTNFEKQTGSSVLPCDTGAVATATRTATGVPGTRTPTATAVETAAATATSGSAATATQGSSATDTPVAVCSAQTATATATPTCHGGATATVTGIPVGTVSATASPTVTGIPTGTTGATVTPEPGGACAGLSGAAFGICNAFCNAQDCVNDPQPSCDFLRSNFADQTGTSIFPCELGGPTPGTGECMGDCEGDGTVTVSDLTKTVLIMLGERDESDCTIWVHVGRSLRITDLIIAVNNALDGCGA